jgi:DNA-binding transcriptional regulator YiaG
MLSTQTPPCQILRLIIGLKKTYNDLLSIILERLSTSDKVNSRISDAGRMIEPVQIRAARALLNWGQVELSKTSGVGTATIRRIETGGSPISANVSTILRIQAALEKAGILFVDEDGVAGIGVRLVKRKRGR